MSADIKSNESHNQEVLQYLSNESVILNLPFILTDGKRLKVGMPYMKLEGNHADAIKLLDIWDSYGFVYLKVRDLKTGRCYNVSWNLSYTGQYWLWSLADLDSLMKISTERI